VLTATFMEKKRQGRAGSLLMAASACTTEAPRSARAPRGEKDCLRLHICTLWRRARHLLLLQRLEGKWPAAVQAATCAAQTSQQSLIRRAYIPTTSRRRHDAQILFPATTRCATSAAVLLLPVTCSSGDDTTRGGCFSPAGHHSNDGGDWRRRE
jgi:hypothetical protein